MNKDINDKLSTMKYVLIQELSKKGLQCQVDYGNIGKTEQQEYSIMFRVITNIGMNEFVVWKPHTHPKKEDTWYWEKIS